MLIRVLREFTRPYRRDLIFVVLLQLAATGAGVYLPNLNAKIIDHGVAVGNLPAIWGYGGWMLLGAIVQASAQIAAVYFGARAGMGVGRDLMAAVFHRTLAFGSEEMNHFGAPSLITRATNDARQIQMFVFLTCTMMVGAPIMMVGGVTMAIREDYGLSWLILLAVATLAVIITVLVIQITPLFSLQQTRIDAINRVLREQITGRRVIRAFTRESVEAARFDAANRDLTDTATKIGVRMMTLFPSVFFVMNLSSVAVMFFGALRVDAGSLQIGQLTAFLQYLMLILMSVVMSTMFVMMAPRAAVCAKRIVEVLDTVPTIQQPKSDVATLATPTARGTLEFQDVTFTYPGAEEPVLNSVSFQVTPGTTTAIIGSTGSGKSTVVSLIPRLFDVTLGRVLIDGADVRQYELARLWERIGLVPQRPYLFSGTIRSNLLFADPEADDERLWQALTVAEAKDFVAALPDGLDAPVSQGGTNISGGQRQRLAIARALVKQPDIYVFDDSFSALDVATDARLRHQLAQETSAAAVVMVAQRVSTIREADQIVVLDEGRVVGIGRHDELVTTCSTYAEIVESQFQEVGR